MAFLLAVLVTYSGSSVNGAALVVMIGIMHREGDEGLGKREALERHDYGSSP